MIREGNKIIMMSPFLSRRVFPVVVKEETCSLRVTARVVDVVVGWKMRYIIDVITRLFFADAITWQLGKRHFALMHAYHSNGRPSVHKHTQN